MATAAVGRLPAAAGQQLRRHAEHRRTRGWNDHRRLLPGALHQGLSLGASGYRRHCMEIGQGEGRDRASRAAAYAVFGQPRYIEVTKVDFYTGSTDKLRTACQLSHKAMQNGVRAVISCLLY